MICHKLNEIEQIADAITIIRDGRTIETLHVSEGDVDEDRIIRGMVGRDLDHRYPPHESHLGRDAAEIRDWTVAHPADRTASSSTPPTSRCAGGRSSGWPA